MKSTDVPNGAVVRGKGGKIVLMDFDEDGCPEQTGTELEPMERWPDGIPADAVVLVHSVKGEKNMLMRSLATVVVRDGDGKPASVSELEKRGELLLFVAGLRKAYLDRASGKKDE